MKIFRKWWFWLLAVLLLIIIIASLPRDEENENNDPDNTTTPATTTTSETTVSDETAASKTTTLATNETSETTSVETTAAKTEKVTATTYESGTYKIGADMPAGEYKVFSTNNSFDSYLEVTKDSTGTLESILANALFNNFIYVTVSDGQYLKIRDSYAIPAEAAEEFKPEDGMYGDGMYKVGYDIPAGEYKVNVEKDALLGMGYVEVAKDSTLSLESIVSNDNIEGNTYITVSEGQYLSLRDVYIQIS